MAVADAVRGLASDAAGAAGLVLEDVAVQSAGRRRIVRVIVDLPDDAVGGVPMDAVAAVSQLLSQRLDDSDAMGGTPYVLEVTSPGVDRPLTERRHWLRARGRLVRVTLRDGGTHAGRLTEVIDEGVVVEGRTVVWDDVARGRVEVEFNRPDADQPGAAADADQDGDEDGDEIDGDEIDDEDDHDDDEDDEDDDEGDHEEGGES
jgi:ribosome maturation factor RimP